MPGSTAPSAERAGAVTRAAVVTHGRPEAIGAALERLDRVAAAHGVELVLDEDERAKHGRRDGTDEDGVDLAVVLGGDGTMLRALGRFLGSEVPVVGVNFGRVGFLSAFGADELEDGLGRVFRGDLVVWRLPALAASLGAERRCAVNDVVVRSSDIGRMVELGWSIGGDDLGVQACDGLICSTPVGSTAYNLSNGGPVLVWGLDAMALTFVAPHSLHARPLVVPKGSDLAIENRTADVPVTVIVDGHAFAEVQPGGRVEVGLDDRRALLGALPETTFFRRYRRTFAS